MRTIDADELLEKLLVIEKRYKSYVKYSILTESDEDWYKGKINALTQIISLISDKNEVPTIEESKNKWIPVSERLPETDNKNIINNYNVLLLVKNKTHPEREPQIYLGKLKHINGDDGSGNIFGIKTKPCDWCIWGWSYFNEPEVVAWMPLPNPYKAESEE